MRLLLDTVRGHEDYGTCVQWLDEKFLITSGDDHQLIVWNTNESLTQVNKISLPSDFWPMCLAVQPDLNSATAIRSASTGPTKVTAKFTKPSTVPNVKSKDNQQIDLNDTFTSPPIAVGSSDGRVQLLQPGSTQPVKQFHCHQGAITAIQYSGDGSALLTVSEDGQVKVWSSSGGLLRCTLATHSHPIHCGVFVDAPPFANPLLASSSKGSANPQSIQAPHVAYTVRDQLIVISLAPNAQPTQTIVHRGNIVRQLAYSSIRRVLATADECGCVRLFDLACHQLSLLVTCPAPCSALDWTSDGRTLAIACAGRIQLFSYSGQLLTSHHLTGVIRQITFAEDGQRFVAIRFDGLLSMFHLTDTRLEWAQFSLRQHSINSATLGSVTSNFEQTLDFPGQFIRHIHFGFDRLLIVLDSQCLCYSLSNSDNQQQSGWLPNTLTLTTPTHLPLLSRTLFALIDKLGNCALFDHQCRRLQLLKSVWPISSLHRLKSTMISLSQHWLITLDPTNFCRIRFFAIDRESLASVRGLTSPSGLQFTHSCEVHQLTVCEDRVHGQSLLAILDVQQHLHLIRLTRHAAIKSYQLLSNCVDVRWHEQAPILIVLQPTTLQAYFCPIAIFTDALLLPGCTMIRKLASAGGGRTSSTPSYLLSCTGGFLQVQLSNGVKQPIHLNPLVVALYKYLLANDTIKALTLVRQPSSSKTLWCIFTSFSLLSRDLDSALVGYSALRFIEKVFYLQRLEQLCEQLKSKTTADSTDSSSNVQYIRASEMALLCGDGLEEAEAQLLNGGYLIRLILIHLQLFNWTRALELARKYDPSIDRRRWTNCELPEEKRPLQRLVLSYRLDYLNRFERKENKSEFRELAQELDAFDEDALEQIEKQQYEFRMKLK